RSNLQLRQRQLGNESFVGAAKRQRIVTIRVMVFPRRMRGTTVSSRMPPGEGRQDAQPGDDDHKRKQVPGRITHHTTHRYIPCSEKRAITQPAQLRYKIGQMERLRKLRRVEPAWLH